MKSSSWLAAALASPAPAMPRRQAHCLGNLGGTVGGAVNGTLGGASTAPRRRAQLGRNVGGTASAASDRSPTA